MLSAFVSANLFTVLGVIRRWAAPSHVEEEQVRERVVVLSYALWQRQFGSDPSVIDKAIEIDGETPDGAVEPIQRLRVVGVMPPGFFFRPGTCSSGGRPRCSASTASRSSTSGSGPIASAIAGASSRVFSRRRAFLMRRPT